MTQLCMCIDCRCADGICAIILKTGFRLLMIPVNIEWITNERLTYIGVSLVWLVRLSGTAPILYLWFFFNTVRRLTLFVVLVDAEMMKKKKRNGKN